MRSISSNSINVSLLILGLLTSFILLAAPQSGYWFEPVIWSTFSTCFAISLLMNAGILKNGLR